MAVLEIFTIRKIGLRSSVYLLAGLSLLLPTFGCQTATATVQQKPSAASAGPDASAGQGQTRVYEDFGIEVIAIRTTAAGSMLDFRFKVLDKEKAMPFFREDLKPHLVDEQSGAVLQVPVPAKGGPMRPTSRDPREGITYFMLFANPGSFVAVGNPVTLVIGDLRVENLVVQ